MDQYHYTSQEDHAQLRDALEMLDDDSGYDPLDALEAQGLAESGELMVAGPDLSGQWMRMHGDRTLRLEPEFADKFRLQRDPFRHPCGELQGSHESRAQFYLRRSRELELFRRWEVVWMRAPSDQLFKTLCSRESLEVKKDAVQRWMAEMAEHCHPVMNHYDPSDTYQFYGFHWACTVVAQQLRCTPEWDAYQRELAAARDGRRPEAQKEARTAMTWLRRNAQAAMKSCRCCQTARCKWR